MGETEISDYISYLAVKRNVAASTQNQALNAIVFLYKQVLNRELGDFGNMQSLGAHQDYSVYKSNSYISAALPRPC